MSALPAVPALVVGTVAHTRHRPVHHAFRYRAYQWLVDIDRLPEHRGPLRWVSGFSARDHLDGGRLGGGIRGDLERFCAHRGVELAPGDQVLMLANARVLGYVFDPLTVFFVLSEDRAEGAADRRDIDSLRGSVSRVPAGVGGGEGGGDRRDIDSPRGSVSRVPAGVGGGEGGGDRRDIDSARGSVSRQSAEGEPAAALDVASRLRTVVFEVHNTYGERHAYLLDVDARGRSGMEKAFYVSPFNDTSGRYAVSLRLEATRVVVSVGLERDGERVLTAVTEGETRPATPREIGRAVLRHGLMPQLVTVLIRLHGLRLWRKLPLQPRPTHPKEAVR